MLWTQVARASIFAMVASAMTPLRQANGTNDGIHLAISPSCGLLGGNYANVNAGIDLLNVRTIVSFGDSYTDGGRHDGGPLAPPVFIPPNPSAGGRVTNGPLWLEDLADDFNLALKDYAVAGAVVNVSLWPSDTGRSDFVNQSALFLSQSNNLDPDTTLYSIFFGINDWHASMVDGDHLPEAAANLLQRIDLLASPPTNGRLFMVLDDYGGENSTASGEAWRQKVFDGLSQLHNNKGVSVAYIDFSPIWRAVKLSDPGFAAFGYTDDGSCLPTDDQTTLAGECSDPAHTFYWFSGHPSKETHRIMANWIERIMVECTTK